MARQHYFYNVMRKSIVQFLDMFNDIVIARYNPDTGAVIKYVKVPLKFAPKTKQWYWTELREAEDRRDWVLPMMAANLDSVEFSKERQVNRNYRVSFSNTDTGIRQYFNPVPYDYSFSLQIAAEYMVDVTQIIEQILPFFTPEAYIRITIPELRLDGTADDTEFGSNNLELRVVYDNSDISAPVEIDEANFRVLIWTLKFKVQGYLFSPVSTTAPIHTVVQNYYTINPVDLTDTTAMLPTDLGQQTMQGVTSATVFPDPGEEVDDDIRNMYAYEHYEKV